ncbi:MAG: EAL domain-containing protein [Epsilonproteobacteria bacterium]|nr:EAL domain-containing protein [Campylobacterota bacterium]
MRTLNMYYEDFFGLDSFIHTHNISNSDTLLIQVFTGINDKKYIQEVLENIISFLPNAIIIGSTTDGEIMNGQVSTHKTIISFTEFEYTRLTVASTQHQENGYYSGKYLAQTLIEDDTKLLIAFADGLHSNGEAFLEGINAIDKSIIVAGGLAGDNATFRKTYVFTKNFISDNGAVCVALHSRQLDVKNDYSFSWRRIGKALTLTHVEANRVYTIDNRTAVETYIHYLGEEMAKGLPAIGIEFPLIMKEEGIDVARAVLIKHDDGSLSFAGNLKEGDKVQLGYGDPVDILERSKDVWQHMKAHVPEAIFVYSCMARRHFMPEDIDKETLPLQELAPTVGFYTYGEFFSAEKKKLLNQTMTMISLREKKRVQTEDIEMHQESQLVGTSVNALIHLANTTANEAMEEEILRKEKDTFELLFNKSPDGILLIDYDTFFQVNQQIVDLFEYKSKEAFLTASIRRIFPILQPDGSSSLEKMYRMRDQSLKEKKEVQGEWLLKKENQTLFWAEVIFTSIVLNGREMIYLVCRDISDRKEMEFELSRQKNILYYQAHHDMLTGLPNRTLFVKELKESLSTMQDDEELALLFIDLDRFKKINDSLGHAIGDKVLTVIGERLKNIIKDDNIAARLGGDEFLVMLNHIRQHNDILQHIEEILQVIEEPVYIDHYTLYTSASIWISRAPIDGHDADNLVKFADTAMYQAKENSSSYFQFYTSEMTDKAYEHLMMEKDLRESIKNGDFDVYYQPQINMQTGEIVGLEALVRWRHPVVGLLFPDVFIPLSEKTGLIVELDFWVMQEAMNQVSQWYKEGLNPGVLALNMSMQELEYPQLEEKIYQNLKNYDFDVKWLELEITETEVMKNPDSVIAILEKLHALGISVAIDDFGTGYSSLSQLKSLPITTLKIDRSFISDIPNDEDAVAIVQTVLALSESLRLEVVAEGIENEVQRDFLLDKGCTVGQGYYYSKPLPSNEIEQLLIKYAMK